MDSPKQLIFEGTLKKDHPKDAPLFDIVASAVNHLALAKYVAAEIYNTNTDHSLHSLGVYLRLEKNLDMQILICRRAEPPPVGTQSDPNL